MKRIINPLPNGGVPFLNSDFSDILGFQNWLPTKLTLDNIISSTVGTSSGIIMGGINVTGTAGGNTTLNFSDAIIYMNGEALSCPNGTFSYPSVNTLYIYESNQVFEQRPLRNGNTANVISFRTFTYSTTNPGSVPRIEISPNINNIKENSCEYQNVMFNYNSPSGEMKFLNNLNSFATASGLGFGRFNGWAICDGRNSTPNLSGRVPVGVDFTDPIFQTIGNTGGEKEVLLSAAQSGLREHTHYLLKASGSDGVSGWTDGTIDSGTGNSLGISSVDGNSGLTSSQPASQPHNNLQPYYVGAWVIKL